MADAEAKSSSNGSSHLEKIKPKDLVMFSEEARDAIAKRDFSSYLKVDYDLYQPSAEEQSKIRVWGLPFIDWKQPALLGVVSGALFGTYLNWAKGRPRYAHIHIHVLTGLSVAIGTVLYKKYTAKLKLEREIIIWDYVKQHPEDFPEVFNSPKKYKDLLLPWNPCR